MTEAGGADISLLCITEGRDYSRGFIDQMEKDAEALGAEFVLIRDGEDVHSGGYLESILDAAVERCSSDYILRLDDDERISPEMFDWLKEGHYRASDHWAFKRRNLWPDESRYIVNPPLWPDLQTRLSVKEKSGSRPVIHQGSPFGTGTVAPVAIDHFKFLVRSREEREALVQRYDNIAPGAGSNFVMFSLPERFEGVLKCEPV